MENSISSQMIAAHSHKIGYNDHKTRYQVSVAVIPVKNGQIIEQTTDRFRKSKRNRAAESSAARFLCHTFVTLLLIEFKLKNHEK